MLNDLDTINWRQLTHAYGPADDIPELIKDLASPSRDIWEKALEKLRGTIWHQGTVYEATAYAIPFLLELLANNAVQCRDEILLDLAYLARGGLKDYTPEAYDWVNNAHKAVAQGLNVYLNLLEDTDPNVRKYVPFVLSSLEELAFSIIPVLDRYLLKENDPQAKANLVLYLASQPGYHSGDDQWLKNLVNAEAEHPFVKTIAAMCHIKQAKAQTPPESIQVLLDTLLQPEMVKELYRTLPWTHGNIIGDIAKDLLLLHFNAAQQVIPILLQVLKNADQIARSKMTYSMYSAGNNIVHALLYFAFEGKPLPKNAVPFLLSSTQREVLTVLLENDAVWVGTEKTAELFDAFGLPYREKLQKLLLLSY